MSAVFNASNDISGNRASEARLSGDGWCSGELATNIFDPYIEVDFGRDVLFTSVAIEGLDLIFDYFIERYRIQVAREDSGLLYIAALSTNNSKLEPTVSNHSYDSYIANTVQPLATCISAQIFPLGQSRISNANRHTESLPRPVIGQKLRINPYEWNNHDYACTKLEVFGCPLQGKSSCIAIIRIYSAKCFTYT